MAQMITQSDSTLVRNHVRDAFIRPAIQRGQTLIEVNVGAIHKALGLMNRVPLVCAALKSKKFLEENHLRLVSQSGPPSGQSTTVTFTYEIVSQMAHRSSYDALIRLRGVAKDVFQQLGGGEAFIRKERNSFSQSALDETE